jgi:anaerobic magnesium-protoporphyrin IX monomethyl ester cyclase
VARVFFVHPWNYHDVGRSSFDLAYEWRNGPYNILLLATILRNAGHEVTITDLHRDLVVARGNKALMLNKLVRDFLRFRPDIVAFSFFSIHYFEVKEAVQLLRDACSAQRLDPIFVAGGIHASVEPAGTLRDLGFDHVVVGEGDIALLRFANGERASEIPGFISDAVTRSDSCATVKGEQTKDLNTLPFPDWSLCDYKFYSHPSYARTKVRKTGSLDVILGRGCVYKCAFCAYNALSAVRFYSAEYLLEQFKYMHKEFGVDSLYFTDSTVGNNRRVLKQFSELMISSGMAQSVSWLANIRPNQVNEEILDLMQRGGCIYLLYGIESNSQRVLDLMDKAMKVDYNDKVPDLHKKTGMIYHASILLGYPGEREEDILETIAWVRRAKPPSVGVNWYVPLPGSPDYDKLRASGVITIDDPNEWRRIGEVNDTRVFADVEPQRFRQLFNEACHLAYVELPKEVNEIWRVRTATSHPENETHPGMRESYVFNFRRRLVREQDILDVDDDVFTEDWIVHDELAVVKASQWCELNDANIYNADGVLVGRTGPQPWSYAAGVPLDELLEGERSGPIAFQFDGEIERGSLGLLIVTEDLSTAIGSELIIKPNLERLDPEFLVLDEVPERTWLILRNTDLEGKPTSFRLRSVRIMCVEDPMADVKLSSMPVAADEVSSRQINNRL